MKSRRIIIYCDTKLGDWDLLPAIKIVSEWNNFYVDFSFLIFYCQIKHYYKNK
jgi:hypothetical protein